MVFDFVKNRLTDSYWGRNRCGEVSLFSGCLLLRKPIMKLLGFCNFCPVHALEKSLFFPKTFGLRFCLKSSHRLILGSLSTWRSFRFLRLSVAEKKQNQVFRVFHFLPAPRLGKIAVFSLLNFGILFCLKSSHTLIFGS